MARYRKGLSPRMGDLRAGRPVTGTAERAAFGLPIPYYDPRAKAGFTLLPGGRGDKEAPDRRASPLMVKVVRLARRKYTLVFTVFLGSRFLPVEQTRLHTEAAELAAPGSVDAVGKFLLDVGPRLGGLARVEVA